MPELMEERLDILRKFAEYDRSRGRSYETEYELGGSFPSILHEYDIMEHIGDANNITDEIVFKALDFVCDRFGHDGNGGMPDDRRIEDIISFCRKNNGKTNCRGLSILLAPILRLYNIKARHITCKPYEHPFIDCHVVVDCLLPSGKRIMLDPTFRLYLKDQRGEYVSLEGLRAALIAGEPVFGKASYNGNSFDIESYRNYMSKNTLRFSRGTLFADGIDEISERRVELIPKGYPIDGFSDGVKADFVYDDAEFWKI